MPEMEFQKGGSISFAAGWEDLEQQLLSRTRYSHALGRTSRLKGRASPSKAPAAKEKKEEHELDAEREAREGASVASSDSAKRRTT